MEVAAAQRDGCIEHRGRMCVCVYRFGAHHRAQRILAPQGPNLPWHRRNAEALMESITGARGGSLTLARFAQFVNSLR